jgi:hypothetical protein
VKPFWFFTDLRDIAERGMVREAGKDRTTENTENTENML